MRAIFLLSFTSNYVVSVRRDFLFFLVLGIGCVILLWHSLCLPYNFFMDKAVKTNSVIKCHLQATILDVKVNFKLNATMKEASMSKAPRGRIAIIIQFQLLGIRKISSLSYQAEEINQMRIYYSKQICLAHLLSFECFHCS